MEVGTKQEYKICAKFTNPSNRYFIVFFKILSALSTADVGVHSKKSR